MFGDGHIPEAIEDANTMLNGWDLRAYYLGWYSRRDHSSLVPRRLSG